MARSGPVGWPRELPPPGTTEFDDRVCGWLLDRGPAELRQSPVRSMPVALARIVSRWVDGSIDAMRGAYAASRVELGDVLTPDEVSIVQSAIEAEGARLLQVQREVGLVETALRRAAGEV